MQFVVVDDKRYLRCADCQLRYLEPSRYLNRVDEYKHYLHHENRIDDPGYRQFLSRLTDPLQGKLKREQTGLDYGCGPGPALAAMMEEAGHGMSLYDPFFHKHENLLNDRYDFVTCTESVEHFHDPAAEFERFDRLLKPDGWLGIMTCFQTDDSAFANWHYRRDPTHVGFYRQETFSWLALHLGWSCEFPGKDVVLMQKPK